MSDIKLVCPVCGGSLKASYGEDSAVCAYCGANVDLKSAIAKLQTEHAMEISVMADNILGLLADIKFAEAQMMANKCLKKMPYAGKLYMCLLMCEYSADVPQKLGSIGEDYTESENYKNCMLCMTEEDRRDLEELAAKNAAMMSAASQSDVKAGMESKANSAFVRDYTQNTIERQRARAEEILASSDDVMQKIAKLSYNDFSDRDIVDHILKNGPHIANIIEDDSPCDADGNTFIDFIESDNNFYFNGLAQCLKEINKPENAQLKAENRERIGKVGRAVFLWNRLNDLIGVLAGVENCQTAEELAESYSEVEDFILNCAEYMRASSSSPHASAAADKYCERQTARRYIRRHIIRAATEIVIPP